MTLPRSSASWANRCARVKLADLVAYGETLEQFAPASRARKLGAVKSLAGFGHRIGYLAFDIGIGAPLRLPAVKATLAERILGLCQVSSLLGATFSGCGASRSSGFQTSVDFLPIRGRLAPSSTKDQGNGGNILAGRSCSGLARPSAGASCSGNGAILPYAN
jgi:hypothetical protein